MFNFKSKNVLITGATGGIGKEICKTFLDNGFNISLVGTSKEKLTDFISQNLDNSKCKAYQCNFKDKEAVKSLSNLVEDEIDIIINNAGITADNLSMLMTDDQWENVLDINLNASFYLIKSYIRKMMKKRYGRIINITSVVAHSGNPGQANYCASKSAILGLTKSLSLELASRSITVNCIAPGFIKTNMTDQLTEDQITNITKNIPCKKLGSSKHIASTALFLASDEAEYITGQTIHVNGGLYLA